MSSTYNPGRVAGFWYLLLILIGPLRLIYVQVAFPAAVPGRLAHHRRLCLCDPQLYGRTVSAIPGQGVYHPPARLLRGAGDHAVARDQGAKPPAMDAAALSSAAG
jgi:hypothetical protein